MTRDEIRRTLKRYPNLDALLTDEQIDRVLRAPKTYRSHPFRDLFLEATGRSTSSQVFINTEQALRILCVDNDVALCDWIRKRIDEATAEKDFSNAASAL